MLLSEQTCVCPFCRAEPAGTEKEALKDLNKQIDKCKDPTAMHIVAIYYTEGKHLLGISKNLQKAEELYKRSYYDLGHPNAACQLFKLYSDHIPDPVLAKKYLEEGARQGNAS